MVCSGLLVEAGCLQGVHGGEPLSIGWQGHSQLVLKGCCNIPMRPMLNLRTEPTELFSWLRSPC